MYRMDVAFVLHFTVHFKYFAHVLSLKILHIFCIKKMNNWGSNMSETSVKESLKIFLNIWLSDFELKYVAVHIRNGHASIIL